MTYCPFENPLIIGAGGGNDIVSATIIADRYRRAGKKFGLAGMLSPGAGHIFNGLPERPINALVRNTRRFIESKVPVEIPFIDPLLLICYPEIYSLSLRHGAAALARDLKDLIKNKGFDGIILVDVGGDILGGIEDRETLLSPLIDHSILRVVKSIECPSLVCEFGLQTDGEISAQRCKDIIRALQARGAMMKTETLSAGDPSYQKFRTIYKNRIEPVRSGHTAILLDKTLHATEAFTETYKTGRKILGEKIGFEFDVHFLPEFFGKMYWINVSRLESIVPNYNILAHPYRVLKNTGYYNNEMDGMYFGGVWYAAFRGTITHASEKIEKGIQCLSDHADSAFIWANEAVYYLVPGEKLWQ